MESSPTQLLFAYLKNCLLVVWRDASHHLYWTPQGFPDHLNGNPNHWVRGEHRLRLRGDSAPAPHHHRHSMVSCHSSLYSLYVGGQAFCGFRSRLSKNKNVKTKLGTRQQCSCHPFKNISLLTLHILNVLLWWSSMPYFIFCCIFGFQWLKLKKKPTAVKALTGSLVGFFLLFVWFF